MQDDSDSEAPVRTYLQLVATWRDLRPTVDNPVLVDALERTFAAVPLTRAS